MAYLRTSLKEDYFEHKQGKSSKHIFVTEPVDLDFELHCLSFYHQIIKKFSAEAEKQSTLEVDQNMLKKTTTVTLNLTPQQRFAVVYRSERKRILRAQLEICAYLTKVVHESFEIRHLTSVSIAFKDIILKPMPSEETKDHWFLYRRYHLRSYF